ncbi:EF-hand domain-containing protein [Pseudomonas soli]|uniref:HvfA family oxazolone/thioamide-modified RiPP metallophore n=1 Tax=Pseudomonas soli TaxID=1306993 RepID=UPI001364B0B1|nr:EF-hand domain-containing protein [Pseudomonas soli]NBK37220.1 EF-hand domain-containing protein [Pseudomonas soli]WJO20105.1 EF-hand domain-containing protein [Pseudomonas soli]
MKTTRQTLSLLGATLLGGMVLGNNAFAVEPLAQGYQLAAAKTPGEGKCGEGKCGASGKATQSEGKCGEGKCGASGKATQSEGKCGEGKCGASAKAGAEGKCGEGKCGDASFARTDSNHDGKVSREEFLAVAKDRAADFDKIDRNHDGFISEQEAHDHLAAIYKANGKAMPDGLFSHLTRS